MLATSQPTLHGPYSPLLPTVGSQVSADCGLSRRAAEKLPGLGLGSAEELPQGGVCTSGYRLVGVEVGACLKRSVGCFYSDHAGE
jgi:hypothetical protein